jgi:hypothetical protein
VLVLVSQSAALPSQSAKGGVHALTWHTLFLHTALALVIAQAVLHAPQFFKSVAMFVSQPSVAMPLQSAKPALQAPTLHWEATQEGVPLGITQATPQPPQLVGLVVMSVSQSFGLSSQSPSPGAQLLMLQTPLVHLAEPPTVEHLFLHAPQLVTSLLVEVSQPLTTLSSQSEKPSVHVIWHWEATHVGVPLKSEHAPPQLPQFNGSFVVLTSQPLLAKPSQSAKFVLHVPTTHLPPLHTELAPGKSHCVSHVPQ